MQSIGKQVGSFTLRGLWIALLMIVGLAMLAPRTQAQATVQNSVVLSAPVSYYAQGQWPTGGPLATGLPVGTSWGMNSMGTIVATTSYGGEVIQFTGGPSNYAVSVVGSYANTGAVAIDPIDNTLWVGGQYSNKIGKTPMNSDGTYTMGTDPSGGTLSDCTGTDASECMDKELANGYFGVESMAFDSHGNLFFATTSQTYSGDPIAPYSIYECVVGTGTGASSCLYGTEAPTLIYTEPGPVTVSYTDSSGPETAQAQLWVGVIAFDSENDLFFTDSAIISDQESAYSDVNELAFDTNTSAYDFANSVLVTDTAVTASQPLPNNGDYDEQITTIAVVNGASHQDMVYFGSTDGGIFAAPDDAGNVNNFYGVANAGGNKLILPDGNGNFYVDSYHGGDTLGFVAVGSAADPVVTGQQQSTTFIVNASDSGSAACGATTPPTLNFDVTGTDPSVFDATAPAQGKCGTTLTGTTFPITVTFSPSALGTDTAILSATDSSTSAAGTANLSGVVEKQQSIGWTTSTAFTYSSGLTIALQASGGRSGNPVTFSLVSGPATLDSTVANQLDVSAPGTIIVAANQAGNATYAPAPTSNRTIVVSPISQSISWAPVPPRNATTATIATGITVTATSATSTDSAQPVTFSMDGSSTCTGASVSAAGLVSGTVTNATCTIVVDANEAASTNDDYAAAPQIQATIDVTATLLPTGAPVILSQSTFLGEITGGGATGGQDPDGGTMVIDPNGNLLVGGAYGGKGVYSFNITNTNPGHQTLITPGASDPTALAIDASGNLFVGNTYGGAPFVVKVPYSSTSGYASYTAAPAAGTNCTGTDTAVCFVPNVGVLVSGSVVDEPIQAMAFDTHGNLFYSIQTDSSGAGTTGIDYEASIWECDANCLYGGGDMPVMIGEEPTVTTNAGIDSANTAFTSLSPTTKVAQILGSLTVDASDNLFLTDAAMDAGNLIHYSDLYEWPVDTNTASGYTVNPITLFTSIPSAPSQYGANPIDGVTIDPTSGDIYFTNDQQIFAFADDLTAPLNPTTVQSTMWTVSGQGGKYIAAGANGLVYEVNYSGTASADAAFLVNVGSVNVLGTIQDGTSATVPDTSNCETSAGLWAACSSTVTQSVNAMYTVLNDGNCTNPETVTFSDTNSDTVFTAALNAPVAPATSTCNGTITDGSFFPTTLTFAPPTGTASGPVSETLTATDSSSNTGSATVSGTAQNLIPQAITGFAGITSPVTYGGGPYTLSATGGASGNPVVFSVDSSSTAAAAVSGTNGTTLTITGAGTLVIDINQAGNATYQAATQVQETITVNPASQTITFTSPSSATNSVAYGAAPFTLAATGGASGNAVTLTIDSSSTGYVNSTTSAAGTLSGSTLTFAGLGTVVIDANQAASTNGDYAAATQVQVSFTVGVASQSITATPSVTSATWSPTLSVTITATASSGLPVTLTQTAGSAIATLTGNTLTPTGTAFGAVTVQATQAGNSDYSAATAQNVTITINPIGQVATPAFSQPAGNLYTNGEEGSYVTLTISDGTAGSAIFYTENDGALTAYPAAGFQLTASDTPYTFTAMASALGYTPSQQASVSYTVSNLAPNFAASASPSAVNLTPGTSALIDVTIQPNASFLGTVSFSCTGAPSGVTCGFSPATLTSTGSGNLTTVVTISDAAATSANRRGPNPFIPGGATFALALCCFGFRKRRNLVLGLVLLAGVFGVSQLTGCGSGGGVSSKGSTTTSMSVVATSTYNGTTITQTIPVTVTVRQ